MTIEIRELVIRAVVDGRAAGSSRPGESSPSSPIPHSAPPAEVRAAEGSDALVARCVREVLRELRRARER